MTATDEAVNDPPTPEPVQSEMLGVARERNLTLRNDLKIIADALLEEAQEREWCSEYDSYVDRVNARTSEPWLQRCARQWAATFTVTVNFTAHVQSDGISAISDHLQNFDDCDVGVDSATVTLRDTVPQ